MITFGNNSYIYNTYSATGEKLMTQYDFHMLPIQAPLSGNGGTTETEGVSGPGGTRSGPATPVDTDHRYYCGNVVYDRGVTRLLTDEGYVTFSGTGAPIYHYYHRDHLGSTQAVTDETGDFTQFVEYTPWGEVFVELKGDSILTTPYLFNGKELDEETGLYYYGARYYDPKVSVWYSTDPMQMDYPWVTTYGYCLGNPIVFYDPDGNSTHTDAEGRIISVVDDYDFGVYKHNGSKEEILKIIQNSHSIMNPSCGGVKMGETYYIDEFKDPQSGEILTEYTIQFGKSFNPIIDSYHDKSLSMNLKEIAAESAGGGIFDIKNKYKNIGGLLNGKYVTSRSAGNFLAGYNAQSGTLLGCRIDFDTFQKLAGALHIEESHGKKLTNMQKASIILKGTYNSSDKSSFVPPMWGEIDYQYRMSVKGWNYGLLNSMKKK